MHSTKRLNERKRPGANCIRRAPPCATAVKYFRGETIDGNKRRRTGAAEEEDYKNCDPAAWVTLSPSGSK
jgi:hypothetical protein